jgi:hypothetical protein
MQTHYINASAEKKRYDDWQRVATLMKRELMALYHSGVLPMERVSALFDLHPELRDA